MVYPFQRGVLDLRVIRDKTQQGHAYRKLINSVVVA